MHPQQECALKVSRTIADLDGSNSILTEHLAESKQIIHFFVRWLILLINNLIFVILAK
jgi:hypothetical protein